MPSPKEQSNERELVEEYLAIVQRLGLSDIAAAGLTSTSPHTQRVVRLGRALPVHARPRASIRRFVELNRGVTTRSEVRIP